MRKNRLIIGVVGGSKTDEIIRQLAKDIGREITLNQHILLTGGVPTEKEKAPVKSVAMNGAKDAGKVGCPARLISVLTKKAKFNIPDITPNSVCKHLVIETPFGDERNFINAYISDVMIALPGGEGTQSEIAFAHYFNIPIVGIKTNGIDTLGALKKDSNIEEFKRILVATHKVFPLFDVDKLSDKIHALLEGPGPNISSTAEEAVSNAIKIAIKSNSLPLSDNIGEDIWGKYETELSSLAD